MYPYFTNNHKIFFLNFKKKQHEPKTKCYWEHYSTLLIIFLFGPGFSHLITNVL